MRPFAIDAVVGAIATASTTAAVTVRVAVPLLPPNDAVIVDVPVPAANALPADGIVATANTLDVHVADAVTFAVVRSEYVAVAVNPCVRPFAMLAVAGATTTVSTTAGVTVSVVVGA